MAWYAELRTKMQGATQALAQPADIQLRLLPSFISTAPFMLHQFIKFFQEGVRNDDNPTAVAEKAILFEVRKSISHHFKDVAGSAAYRAHVYDTSIQARLSSLMYSPDELATDVGLLSREGLQSSAAWQLLRQVAREALHKLDWPMDIPSPAWQLLPVKLRGSLEYCEVNPEPVHNLIPEEDFILEVIEGDMPEINEEYIPGIYEQYTAEIVLESGYLLVKHSYTEDVHFGTKWIHRLKVEASEKAKMLSLLENLHDVTDSLVPADARLLDVIFHEFCTLHQIRLWLRKNSVPCFVWHEQVYPM